MRRREERERGGGGNGRMMIFRKRVISKIQDIIIIKGRSQGREGQRRKEDVSELDATRFFLSAPLMTKPAPIPTKGCRNWNMLSQNEVVIYNDKDRLL